MVAAKLIVGAAVGGTQIDALVGRRVRTRAKQDAHESPCSFEASGSGTSDDVHIDGAVLKTGFWQERERVPLFVPGPLDQPDSVLARVLGRSSLDAFDDQLVRRGKGNAVVGGGRRTGSRGPASRARNRDGSGGSKKKSSYTHLLAALDHSSWIV